MLQNLFMTAEEVAEELCVSKSYAYKIIKQMNEELKANRHFTMRGKVDRKYFHDQIYGTRTQKEDKSGSI